jgi:hypothetical protein
VAPARGWGAGGGREMRGRVREHFIAAAIV